MTETEQIYQLKVTLQELEPLIWRQIQLSNQTRLDRLHEILQVVMGWENYHLHQFIANQTYYGQPHPDYDDEAFQMLDERLVTLADLGSAVGFTFAYEYDFGDSWRHLLLLEEIGPLEETNVYPCCIGGERACPPEDVGGVGGYADFLGAIQDPAHPEYEPMRTWIGGDFDPEAFDLTEVNRRLWSLETSLAPQWIEDLVGAVSVCLSVHSPMGPLGYRYLPDEEWWILLVYPTPVELLGGAEDGAQMVTGFTLEVRDLLAVFSDIEAIHWQTQSFGDHDLLGPHLSIEGVYQDHQVWLQVLAEPPEDEEPQMKLSLSEP